MLVTKQELLDKVTGLLGGRASEEIFIGEIGTGAYSDFQQATSIVRSMIVEYGMSEKLGPMQFGTSQGQVFLGRDIGHEQNYSDKIAYEIDQEMQRFISESYERCKNLLVEHADKVRLIAETLLEVETLELEQIKSLIETGKLPESDNGGSDEGTSGEPVVDNIGDVKVRIQGKNEDPASGIPQGDIPNDVPNGSANDATSDPVVDTPPGTVKDAPAAPDDDKDDKGQGNGGNTPTV
ncbi:ATP-dependent zinc metalloprotease FtsH [compost metagenome]